MKKGDISLTICKYCNHLKEEGDELYCELKRINNVEYIITKEKTESIQQCDCWFFRQEQRKQEDKKTQEAIMLATLFRYSGQ